jgi:hypothetical protein
MCLLNVIPSWARALQSEAAKHTAQSRDFNLLLPDWLTKPREAEKHNGVDRVFSSQMQGNTC